MDDTEKIPRYLYRVVDGSTHCKYDKNKGFEASKPYAAYNPKHWNAKPELELHMDWSNRKQTPFISVTSSREKALELALKKMKLDNGNVLIAKIDSLKLRTEGVQVYHMEGLVKLIGAVIKPEGMNSHEYLCVRRIPRSTIIEQITFGDLED